MHKFIGQLIAIAGLLMVVPAWSSSCDVGFAVTFFNGVANTLQDADSAKFATRDAIQEMAGTPFDVYDSQPVSYDVAYNTTQGTAGDVFETFVQRAKQIDPSGQFGADFAYLYWSYLAGSSQNYPGSITSALPPSLATVSNVLDTYSQATRGVLAASLANLLNTAPTNSDIAVQQATLTADANNGRLQLLVAHSQGNLFVDDANVFLSQSGLATAGQYSTVHVAPATSVLYGPYELSSKDLVINGLGLIVGGIRQPNMVLPFSLSDPQGHGYQEIYLNAGLTDTESGLSARARLQGLFRDALKALDSQQCQLKLAPATTTANPGDSVPLTATLTPGLSPSLDSNHITVKYKWTIAGNVGGTFTDPLTGGLVTTAVTTQPNISYHAYNAAQSGLPGTDQVSVEVDVSTPDNGAATTKVLASGASASITVQGNGLSISPATYTFKVPHTEAVLHAANLAGIPANAIYTWSCKSGSMTLVGQAGGFRQTLSVGNVNVYYLPPAWPVSGAAASDVVTLTITSPGGQNFGTAVATMNYGGLPFFRVIYPDGREQDNSQPTVSFVGPQPGNSTINSYQINSDFASLFMYLPTGTSLTGGQSFTLDSNFGAHTIQPQTFQPYGYVLTNWTASDPNILDYYFTGGILNIVSSMPSPSGSGTLVEFTFSLSEVTDYTTGAVPGVFTGNGVYLQ